MPISRSGSSRPSEDRPDAADLPGRAGAARASVRGEARGGGPSGESCPPESSEASERSGSFGPGEPNDPSGSPPPSRRRLSLLASLFLTLVVVIVWQRHAILVPLYAGLLAWLKALFKALTPKLLLVVVKHGLVIKTRQLVTGLVAQFLVFSHRPWRRRVTAAKLVLLGALVTSVRWFVASPLWFRAAVALVVLAATATSAYAFVALLIIPQPIVDWIKVRGLAFLKKLGVTRGLDTLWRRAVPEPLRHRWHLFAKWRLGRRQVLTSRRFHQRVERRVAARLAGGSASTGSSRTPATSLASTTPPKPPVPPAPSASTALQTLPAPTHGSPSRGTRRPATSTASTDLVLEPRDPFLSVGTKAEVAGRDWARSLPPLIDTLRARWNVVDLQPIGEAGHDGTASWVAACALGDGRDAVMKIAFPHHEGRDEIPGLAFWNGEAAVRLLASDAANEAMLLERCVPGTALRERPEAEQDAVIAALLNRLWQVPPAPHPFRPLAEQMRLWSAAARERTDDAAADPVLVGALAELEALAAPRADDVLLATDLHAGNVLAATREPWLVIDPKPYVGDRAYDLTQHLLNGRERMTADPVGASDRLAALAGVDANRVRRWLAARLVAEADWYPDEDGLARAIAARLREASSAPTGR